MFSRIGMLILVIVFPTDILCDLCDADTIHYIIGQNVTILDISSEDISVLSASCIKEIRIPDSLYALVYVEEANFGGNQGFEYSDQGLTPKISRDSAFLIKQCQTPSPETEKDISVVKGLLSYVKRHSVCIRFVPELNLRSLGYRVWGGRIKLVLQVIFAICNSKNTNAVFMPRTSQRDSCRPICSVRGVESMCEVTQTSSFLTTQRKLTSDTPIYAFTNKTHEAIQTGPRMLTAVENTYTTWKSTLSLHATDKTTPAIPFVNLRQPTYVGISSTEIHISTRSISTLSSYNMNQWETSMEIYQDNSTDHANNTGQEEYETTVDNVTQTSSDASSSKTFALLEVLCVLVGCLVIFLAFATIRYFYRRHKALGNAFRKHGSKFSDSSYISRWRDNWFLRYHANEQSDVSDCLSEAEISLKHGCPQHISDEDSETYKSEDRKQSFKQSNPLPLIRLSSSFVKNTKSLDALSDKYSDICQLSVEKSKVKQKMSRASSDSGIGRHVFSDAQKTARAMNKSKSLKDNSESSMKERLRRVKRVNSHLWSHGSYDVSKAQILAYLSNKGTTVNRQVE